jgi:hypothetical protein
MNKNIKNLIGQRFGRLVVTEYAGATAGGKAQWTTVCDCGVETVKTGVYLRKGITKSCGCLRGENTKLPEGVSARNSILRSYKKHAKERNLVWEISESLFNDLTSRPCFYCGVTPGNKYSKKDSNGVFIYNGVDRSDSHKGYFLENVVPCCAMCNRAKMVMIREEFLSWVDRVYLHQHKSEAARA